MNATATTATTAKRRSSLRVAQRVACTEAEGPGRRFALWLQGCPLRCRGCCNPEMLPFAGGEKVEAERLLREADAAQRQFQIEGVSLLGGEPTAQAGVADFAEGCQEIGLSVMVYSGWTLEELHARREGHIRRLLEAADLLVDGRYDPAQPDAARRWIGSTNQKLHFLSDRYRKDDPQFAAPDTLELRLRGGQLLVNGFPAPSAVSVWRRSGRRGERSRQ